MSGAWARPVRRVLRSDQTGQGTGHCPAVGRRCPSGSDPESTAADRRPEKVGAKPCPGAVLRVAGGEAGGAHRSHPEVVVRPPTRETPGARRGPDVTHRGWGECSRRAAHRVLVLASPRPGRPQLAENAPHVGADGVDGEEHGARDLLGGQELGQVSKDLQLPGRQLLDHGSRRLGI